MMSDRSYGWAMVGLAALGTISAGVLAGQQASAEMAPFYANLATTMPEHHQLNSVEFGPDDNSDASIETADLSYSSATTNGTQDASY